MRTTPELLQAGNNSELTAMEAGKGHNRRHPPLSRFEGQDVVDPDMSRGLCFALGAINRPRLPAYPTRSALGQVVGRPA